MYVSFSMLFFFFFFFFFFFYFYFFFLLTFDASDTHINAPQDTVHDCSVCDTNPFIGKENGTYEAIFELYLSFTPPFFTPYLYFLLLSLTQLDINNPS
jgi:hypothetical protein